METSQLHRNKVRKKRAFRVRKQINGDANRPRLSVFRSARHIYAQIIDDENSLTLASTSTLSKEFQKTEYKHKNKDSAKHLGLKIAELAKAKNISAVVFDRGRFKYHGIVAALADGAREGGLQL